MQRALSFIYILLLTFSTSAYAVVITSSADEKDKTIITVKIFGHLEAGSSVKVTKAIDANGIRSTRKSLIQIYIDCDAFEETNDDPEALIQFVKGIASYLQALKTTTKKNIQMVFSSKTPREISEIANTLVQGSSHQNSKTDEGAFGELEI